MGKNKGRKKLRVSFDLDEVLFVSPKTHETEPALPFPLNKIYKERLRFGAAELINNLQKMGYEVWIYTSSFRTERYIKKLFGHYGVRLDGIVNGKRHLEEVQKNQERTLPSKLPNRFGISLHIDDEQVVCNLARQYGYNVLRLKDQDHNWKEKIIERVNQIRNKDFE